jgi:cellulose biosynthesis protein BcsQ
VKTIAFFATTRGVGKTWLVYHLAHMYAEKGTTTLAVDLDPQANLTSMFLDSDRVEEVWPDGPYPLTIAGALEPSIEGTGDISPPHVEIINDRLGLLVGDLALALSEDELNAQWPRCLDAQPRAFRVLSAFWRLIESAAQKIEADTVLIDVGPNLAAINRAALLAAQFVAVPLSPLISIRCKAFAISVRRCDAGEVNGAIGGRATRRAFRSRPAR